MNSGLLPAQSLNGAYWGNFHGQDAIQRKHVFRWGFAAAGEGTPSRGRQSSAIPGGNMRAVMWAKPLSDAEMFYIQTHTGIV